MTTVLPSVARCRGALASGKAVVTLESTVIAQGLPWPENLETVQAVHAAVRGRELLQRLSPCLTDRSGSDLSESELLERLRRPRLQLAEIMDGSQPLCAEGRALHLMQRQIVATWPQSWHAAEVPRRRFPPRSGSPDATD